MNVFIYGIVGQAGALQMAIEELDIDELEVGREFMHRGKIYEIRSINDSGSEIRLNVVALEPGM